MPPNFKNPSGKDGGPRVIYWFRTDLRLHDSPALNAALALNPSAFYPIWTWDPHYVYRARVGPNRWKFLLESQSDLSQNLSKLNPKQKLLVVREAPQTVLPKLFRTWRITHLVFEKDTDAYARNRDDKVLELAKQAGVEVIVRMGRTLFDPDEVVKKHGGKPTMSMSQLVKAVEGINKGQPEKPLPTPDSLPDPGDVDLSSIEKEHEIPDNSPDFNEVHRGLKSKRESQYHKIMGPNGDFAVPKLEELGIDPKQAASPHKGGETEALRLLKTYTDDEEYIGTFEKPKSAPTDFEPQSTTLLSPHHHFGTLSVRKFWWDVQDIFERRKKAKKPIAAEPVNMPGQLLFRDMYFAAQAALGYSYAQTQGNPVARFIPWHLQSNYSSEPLDGHLLDGTYTVDSEQAEEWFRRWKDGRTGFPWIDALMRQLKHEGWIHHLGRHAVACFLTRGGCYVHWERGAEVFEEWLVDHETACNVGNWMWLSCTAFYSQFYRCYSPIAFPKKWDPEGTFVRRYVPELANFDKRYIYEPHKAPIKDQRDWGCVIKGDGMDQQEEEGGMRMYPKPMFDFSERRQVCIDAIKHAYDVGMHGDDKRVLNGSWKKIFDFDDKGAQTKDETNGALTSGQGQKRGRAPPLHDEHNGDDHNNDDGGDADKGDLAEDEDNVPRRKAPRNGIDDNAGKGRKGKSQKTLDTMVSRRKK